MKSNALPINDTMMSVQMASNYHFSAVKLDNLGATEYTLAAIHVDVSGSVGGFEKELEGAQKTIVSSCQKSPRAENLMIRTVTFNDTVTEFHGFKLLNSINESDYDGFVDPDGMTALFDSVYSGIEALKDYAKLLSDQDFLANAVIFIITDGMDNRSSHTPKNIKTLLNKAMKEEVLESITTVLIGINAAAADIQQYLQEFKNEAELTQYVDAGAATAKNLAKLANFVSQSISSTSQALGSGQPSQLLKI